MARGCDLGQFPEREFIAGGQRSGRRRSDTAKFNGYGVSPGVETRYFTLQKTIDVIHRAAPRQRIFIVCKTPQDVLTLVRGDVPIQAVNVGNMHFAEGKRQIHKTVSVDDDDIAAFRELARLGVRCEIRRVPDESGEPVDRLLD